MKKVLLGAISGAVATAAMDAVGTIIWERFTSESAKAKEREVEPKFPLAVLAERIARRLQLDPIDKSSELISNLLHWSIGIVCGALHGALEEPVPAERIAFAQPIALGMLTVDEFGFTAAGLAPEPRAFPWETHARATVSHMAYGVSLAIVYEGLKAYFAQA